MAAAKSFITLLKEAIATVKKRYQPLLVGALIVAVVGIPLNLFSPPMQEGATANPSLEQAGFMILFGLISFVVSIAINLAYFLIAVKGEKSLKKAIKQCPYLIIPLFKVMLWKFLRTYTWLFLLLLPLLLIRVLMPSEAVVINAILSFIGLLLIIVGIVCAILLGPRYSLATYIYLQEGMAPKKAVDTSYKRTKGYWWKIVGNGFLLSGLILLIILPIMLLAFLVLVYGSMQDPTVSVGMIFMGTGLIAGPISTIVSMFIKAFQLIFWAHMTQTITAHPRKG